MHSLSQKLPLLETLFKDIESPLSWLSTRILRFWCIHLDIKLGLIPMIWMIWWVEKTRNPEIGQIYFQRSTALSAAQALNSVYNTQYKVGTGADTLCKLFAENSEIIRKKNFINFRPSIRWFRRLGQGKSSCQILIPIRVETRRTSLGWIFVGWKPDYSNCSWDVGSCESYRSQNNRVTIKHS